MKRWNRILSVLTAVSMILTLAACGGKSGEDKNSAGAVSGAAESKEYLWVPEFLQSDALGENFYQVLIKGDTAYYLDNEWDTETFQSKYTVKGIALTDGSGTVQIPLDVAQMSEEERETGIRSLDRFALDQEGNIITLEEVYHWSETGNSSQEYFLCKYDASGARVMETDFTDKLGDDSYISFIAVDGEGRTYVDSGQTILLFDAGGAFSGKFSVSGDVYINALGMDRDGVMCAVVHDYSGGQSNVTLREIDFAGKAFGKSYANYPGGGSDGSITPGVEKATLVHDGSRVYEYDKATETAEELFSWLDSDINGSNVNCIGVLEDGRILAVSRDWESGETEIALLTKKKASEVPQKETITVACLYGSQMMQSVAVRFNKSNEKYRISIRNYYDYNQVTGDNYQEVMNDAISRLNNDITSNNCPDLLDLTGLNAEQLSAKGVFEDLNPYLEKSGKLNREDYIESILQCYNYGGVQVAIPRTFEIMTVVGKASEVGAEPGWTLQDMLDYANRHPDAAIFDYASKSDILSFLISYNQGAFVDWGAGKCSFDTDSFVNLLEFANRFPDEYDWNSDDDRSTPTKIAAGDVLLDREYLYRFNSIQEAAGKFNEPVTFIGYPNDEGGSGSYIQADGLVAIASKSKQKDGAWEFLEQYLTADSAWYDFGFSARKDKLQEDREAATKVEYILDEEGNPLLDENGEPLTFGAGGSIAYEDGWTYEYHVTTEEEADLLMHLIEIAMPVNNSDSQIMGIITEEAEAFFKGDKSAKDVAGVIQSRVQLYVNENR